MKTNFWSWSILIHFSSWAKNNPTPEGQIHSRDTLVYYWVSRIDSWFAAPCGGHSQYIQCIVTPKKIELPSWRHFPIFLLVACCLAVYLFLSTISIYIYNYLYISIYLYLIIYLWLYRSSYLSTYLIWPGKGCLNQLETISPSHFPIPNWWLSHLNITNKTIRGITTTQYH